jgi:hypothetical protein
MMVNKGMMDTAVSVTGKRHKGKQKQAELWHKAW